MEITEQCEELLNDLLTCKTKQEIYMIVTTSITIKKVIRLMGVLSFCRFIPECIREIIRSPEYSAILQRKDVICSFIRAFKITGSVLFPSLDIDIIDIIEKLMMEAYQEWKQKIETRQAQMATQEQLAAIVWHPSRVEKWIEHGIDMESICNGFIVSN
jgi:isocitrate dehydrogenase kinase/phosphatase